jgi:hypothetical protein
LSALWRDDRTRATMGQGRYRRVAMVSDSFAGSLRRRQFIALAGLSVMRGAAAPGVQVDSPEESIEAYLRRTSGRFDLTRYRQILGAANAYKEGDDATGVAAPDETSRVAARSLLSNTRIRYLAEHSVYEDSLSRYISRALIHVSRPRYRVGQSVNSRHFCCLLLTMNFMRFFQGCRVT